MFAILFEALLVEIQEESLILVFGRGAVSGHRNCEPKFNKLAFPMIDKFDLCAKSNSPSVLQNSSSLEQNLVSSLFRNSALETVFHLFPSFLKESTQKDSGTKCSKSRDLTAIAICDSNRESQITSDLRQCEPSQKSSLF